MAATATRIAILGAGRMGAAIANQATASPDVTIVAVWARDPSGAEFGDGILVSENLDAVLETADVAIDFSLPAATQAVCTAVATAKLPLVCGVSGLREADFAALEAAAAVVPVVYDRNMSQGIAVLGDLVRRVAAALGPEFSVRIDETHHVHKKDAPSGTALQLGEAVSAARKGDVEYHSERRGEVPGDHRVEFRSATESLSLEHSVTTRDVFALGALRAATWVRHRSPGLYSMRNVLFGD